MMRLSFSFGCFFTFLLGFCFFFPSLASQRFTGLLRSLENARNSKTSTKQKQDEC